MSNQLVAVVFLALAGAACGGGSSTPCEAAAQAYCDRACECTDGDECRVFDGTATSTADDKSSCLFFNEGFGCSADEQPTDEEFDACAAAVDSAMCVEQGGESGMMQAVECQGIFL